MESGVQYLHEIEVPRNDALPIRLIHPQNLDLQYQRIAKSSIISAPKDLRIIETLKLFQSCPYMPIRQLVSSFISAPRDYHNAHSSLLTQRLNEFPENKRIDQMLECQLREYRHEQRCFQKLGKALAQYLKEWDAAKANLNEFSRNSQTYFNLEDRVIYSNFDYYWSEFTTLNTRFKKSETQYFSLKHYGEFLSRACTELVRTHKYQGDVNTITYPSIKQYWKANHDNIEFINKDITIIQQQRFFYSQKIKFEDLSNEDVNRLRKNEIQKYRRHYAFMGSMAPLFNQQMNELRQMYERFRDNYRQFLPRYNKYEDVHEMREQDEHYRQVVLNEQKRLTDHLRKHYELMMSYESSTEYAFLDGLIKKKHYNSQRYSGEMKQLDSAIMYLNGTYAKIFRALCANKGDMMAMNQIRQNTTKFRDHNPEDGYNTIILDSLARLEKLASK